VPATVTLAVKSISKIFAGELIERAREIQSQWLALSGDDQVAGELPAATTDHERHLRAERNRTMRGPLTPDHLREALRRMRMEKAGGVGLLGLDRMQHPTGQERFGIKTGGKRLFR
jgi:transcription initiation factor TFIID subunit 11